MVGTRSDLEACRDRAAGAGERRRCRRLLLPPPPQVGGTAATRLPPAPLAVLGCLIGDALGVGPHWYYDLDVLRKEFGWIDGYVASKTGRYHEGMSPGDLSQTGEVGGVCQAQERSGRCCSRQQPAGKAPRCARPPPRRVQVAELLLRSLSERGRYDPPDFTRRFDALLDTLDGTPYCVVDGRTNYTDVAMRDVWRAIKVRGGGGHANKAELS